MLYFVFYVFSSLKPTYSCCILWSRFGSPSYRRTGSIVVGPLSHSSSSISTSHLKIWNRTCFWRNIMWFLQHNTMIVLDMYFASKIEITDKFWPVLTKQQWWWSDILYIISYIVFFLPPHLLQYHLSLYNRTGRLHNWYMVIKQTIMVKRVQSIKSLHVVTVFNLIPPCREG